MFHVHVHFIFFFFDTQNKPQYHPGPIISSSKYLTQIFNLKEHLMQSKISVQLFSHIELELLLENMVTSIFSSYYVSENFMKHTVMLSVT